MTGDAKSDLIEITVDGRRYVGVPLEVAGRVSQCINRCVSDDARKAGVDRQTVPLWGLALQLAIAAKVAASSAPGTDSGADAALPPLSVRDVAARSDIGARGVRKAAEKGRLRGRKLGSAWRFWPADVEDWDQRRATA